MKNGQILIVEDDISFGSMLQKWFERNGFSVTLCPGMLPAQETLTKTAGYKVVLSDLRLPDGDGIMLLNWLNEKHLPIPVIIMTSYGEVRTAVSAIKLGAFDFLEKPINPDILAKKIELALEAGSGKAFVTGKRANERKPYMKSREFVRGQSWLSSQMYAHIDLVSPTQMAVMIIGESGTGKEHVAHLIHSGSNRANGPFVAVDCGSLSIELAPSELFGHRKGSFTSSIEDKTGFFREADGGTLFLDEVGNLPYGVQMQILRTLQEKKVRAVGSSTDLDVDVRIVTATNGNLEKAIDEGKFREDLYHRLNEFIIKVPSLREKADDIALYANYFREEANNELGRKVTSVSPDAMEVLMNYSWPGNLRELRNVIRRSVLFSKGQTITLDSLPVFAAEKTGLSTEVEIFLTTDSENEKMKICKALEQANGNKTKAAILLQIDRKTLYNKLHQYNIEL